MLAAVAVASDDWRLWDGVRPGLADWRTTCCSANQPSGPRSPLFLRETLRNLRILARLAPEQDLIAPWIDEAVIIAVELGPIMVAPQEFGTKRLRRTQNAVR